MHLYKHFWKMVKMNRTGLIIYSVIMIIMIISISMAAKQSFQSTEEGTFTESYDISYRDDDRSAMSKGLLEYLGSKNKLSDYSEKTEEDINTLVFFSVTSYYMEIPEGFEEAILRGEEKNIIYRSFVTGSSYIYSISNDIDSYVNTYKTYMDRGYTAEEAARLTQEVLNQEVSMSVWSGEEEYREGTMKEWMIYQTSVFLIYLTFGMLALTIGLTIINNNADRVAKRIEAGPVSTWKRSLVDTIGLYSGGVILWFIYLVVVCIAGRDTPLIQERGLYLALTVLVSLICNCSMTSLLASFSIKGEVLSMVVNIVGLSLSFLSGVFVPQWLLAEGIVNISKFFPFYWLVNAMSRIYTGSGAGLSFAPMDVYKNLGIGLLFSVVLFLLSVAVRKLKK